MDNSIVEHKHIIRIGLEDCHYTGNTVAGARLCQYAIDCVSMLGCAREGMAGMLANINANCRSEVHALDELEITARFESCGNTSRKYSFKIVKTIEYATDGAKTAVLLDEPRLVMDGTAVLVRKPH